MSDGDKKSAVEAQPLDQCHGTRTRSSNEVTESSIRVHDSIYIIMGQDCAITTTEQPTAFQESHRDKDWYHYYSNRSMTPERVRNPSIPMRSNSFRTQPGSIPVRPTRGTLSSRQCSELRRSHPGCLEAPSIVRLMQRSSIYSRSFASDAAGKLHL